MKLQREDWRYIIIIIFIVLQTFLITTGHGKLDSDVLRLDQSVSQASASQCQRLESSQRR